MYKDNQNRWIHCFLLDIFSNCAFPIMRFSSKILSGMLRTEHKFSDRINKTQIIVNIFKN